MGMIRFWAVYVLDADRIGKPIDLNDEPMLTLCSRRRDCLEYIDRHVKIVHREHFIQWCELRDKDPEDCKTWNEYSSANIDERYIVRKLRYSKAHLASMLRMLLQTTPLNCSFENEYEQGYFLSNTFQQEEPEQGESEE